ncbi:FliO/MopB family protein [Krasilnikovia sp. MM14-A1004]|uniref:FliO/MopB family protein n=1 Tax=Krasilnikovia sp. MM14-A1004 TaxID=3373541 RepID=UPI00399C9E59
MIELVLRIGFSLLIVFGLMWGLAKVVRRPLTGRHRTPNLAVLDRQQLARGAVVTVVQVADKALILGVTDQHVSLLGETDLLPFEPPPHVHTKKRDPVSLEPEVMVPPVHTKKRDPVSLKPEAMLEDVTLPADLAVKHRGGRLDGSVLSPNTWRATMEFLRDRTSRR